MLFRSSRDSRYGGGNDEREQTLNQLLAEMDGFDASKGILIHACAASAEIAIKPKGFEKRRHSTDGSSGIDENQMPIFLSSIDG